MDARPKLLLTLALIVLVSATPQPGFCFICALLVLVLLLCLVARIPLDYLLLRSAVIVPFTGFAALSLALTTPAQGSLWEWGRLSLSEPGLRRAAALLLRSWVAVSLMIILINTCPFDRLLRAMRSLGLPGLFVMLLSFLYRYLYLLWDEIERLQRARNVRYFGGRWRSQAALAGNLAATLFLRSYERAERVQKAMAARGWNGEVDTRAREPWRRRERAILAAGGAFLALLWLIRHH
jgi:cobalt/nickel transport system permease protein